ncbi:hypothetical protein EV359DRAFT_74615 [Lentinula novae-zelandiae]|nr:hypothetical protein EV359DRAFT_74615 [Lentinula novae-zelandiae]
MTTSGDDAKFIFYLWITVAPKSVIALVVVDSVPQLTSELYSDTPSRIVGRRKLKQLLVWGNDLGLHPLHRNQRCNTILCLILVGSNIMRLKGSQSYPSSPTHQPRSYPSPPARGPRRYLPNNDPHYLFQNSRHSSIPSGLDESVLPSPPAASPEPEDELDEDDLNEQQDIRIADEFIQLLREATLENSGLDERTIERLRNPIEGPPDELDPDTRLSIDLYLSITHASEATYSSVRNAILLCFPETNILSYHCVKSFIADTTGVISVYSDMCVNSCHAFTGPWTDLEHCFYCNEPRYDLDQLRRTGDKVPRLQCTANRRSPEGADGRKYRSQKLDQIRRMVEDYDDEVEGAEMIYDDIWCGEDVRQLVENIGMTEDDLYQNKKSDCWIGIWINQDYAPDSRFKKKKPKHTDSFLFPGLHHLSALQKENNGRGMKKIVYQRVIFLLGLADALGMVEWDGRGCRHKPNSGHYYAHPDTDIQGLEPQTAVQYDEKIAKLRASKDKTEYKYNQKATGLSKPSILSGLHPGYSLPIPQCFGLDLMHLLLLNLEDLLLCLWRGTLKREVSDTDAWEWVKLVGSTWEDHGKTVANTTQYFPSSFQRPPRNPAEKLSSGYKATEYYLYVFGLGPGLFRTILDAEYWQNFCQLTSGVRILLQWSITGGQIQNAQRLLVNFAEGYENLYYQRREDRLHFCRPCVHTVGAHAVSEIIRLGPGAYSTQFAMERTIGDLGQEVKQPSNPFANLAQRALRRAQVNALKIILPEVDSDTGYMLPKGAIDLGEGRVLLRPRERKLYQAEFKEGDLLMNQFGSSYVRRWGRFRLPNGQIARSLYVEQEIFKKRKPRNTRNIKSNGITEFGEVWYYFITTDKEVFAMVSVYGRPDPDLLCQSSNALWACKYLSSQNLHVVPVARLQSVVSMQPLPIFPHEQEGQWFVVQKPGINNALITGHKDNMDVI